MKKKSFVMYDDWKDLFETLSDNEAGRLIKAVFEYTRSGAEAPLEGSSKMLFMVIRNQLIRDGEKWEETCRKRSECGKLGGRPKKSDNAEKAKVFSEKQKKAKKADNEDDNVNADVNVNENKNEDINVNTDEPPLLTAEQEQELVSLSCRRSVDIYIQKITSWQKAKGRSVADPYSIIKKWINEDSSNKTRSDHKSSEKHTSYDLDEFEKYAESFQLYD